MSVVVLLRVVTLRGVHSTPDPTTLEGNSVTPKSVVVTIDTNGPGMSCLYGGLG